MNVTFGVREMYPSVTLLLNYYDRRRNGGGGGLLDIYFFGCFYTVTL